MYKIQLAKFLFLIAIHINISLFVFAYLYIMNSLTVAIPQFLFLIGAGLYISGLREIKAQNKDL